ncbi:riboflavin synthase [soil metagenome]
MFTGIVTATGTILEHRAEAGDARVIVATDALDSARRGEGASICVHGVCLTVQEPRADGFAADVSAETLARTMLGELGPGDAVNLEPALVLGESLGGHLVSGHVDGVGRVLERQDVARAIRLEFEAPRALAPFIAAKGSICIDGVSLTVNEVGQNRFDVMIVPHTQVSTTLGGLQPGDPVNIEVDLIARYLARYLDVQRSARVRFRKRRQTPQEGSDAARGVRRRKRGQIPQ